MLTTVFHGKIPPTVITPKQMKQQLEIVANNIGTELMIPGDDQRGHISQLYTMLTAKVRVTKDILIIKIMVPLVSREFYNLYHIVPVPFVNNKQLTAIIPSTQYIAVNLKQDHYYMLTKEDKQACKVFEDNELICNQNKPLFNIQGNVTQCEMAVMLDPKVIHENCVMETIDKQQIWIELAAENNYLYTMRENMSLTEICGTKITRCTLAGSGILTIPKQCLIKVGSVELSSRNVIKGDVTPIMLVPHTNITETFPSGISTNNNIQNFAEIINNPEFETLTKAIQQQKKDADEPLMNMHDIHQYTISYTLASIMIIILIVYLCKQRLQRMCKQETSQLKNSNKEQEMVVINMNSSEDSVQTLPIAASRFARPAALDKWTTRTSIKEETQRQVKQEN